MKKLAITLSLAIPATALAGGFEVNNQVPDFIYKDGRYVEFGMNLADPEITGTLATPGGEIESGNMAKDFANYQFAYKAPINNKLDWAITYTEPFAANVNYPAMPPQGFYPYQGSNADLKASAITALLKYSLNDNITVFGGPKFQEFEADANVVVSTITAQGPAQLLNYTGDSDPSTASGYVLGAAYEINDIALRVGLTYNSEITHTNDVIESATGLSPADGQPFSIGDTPSTTDTTLPQSLNLSFQSGVTKKTLVFGSVHWAEWSATEIAPTVYGQVTGQPLVTHDEDSTAYSLGVARRLNDNVALALIYRTEAGGEGPASNLSPTNGVDSYSLGINITEGKANVTAGVSYVVIGDAYTEVGPSNTDFSDNSALGFGLKIGYTF